MFPFSIFVLVERLPIRARCGPVICHLASRLLQHPARGGNIRGARQRSYTQSGNRLRLGEGASVHAAADNDISRNFK